MTPRIFRVRVFAVSKNFHRNGAINGAAVTARPKGLLVIAKSPDGTLTFTVGGKRLQAAVANQLDCQYIANAFFRIKCDFA